MIKEKLLKSLKLSNVNEEIENLIDLCIEKCLKNVKLIKYVKYVDILDDHFINNNDKVFIPKEIKKPLKGCSKAVFVILSLGSKTEKHLDSEKDEYTKYLISEIYDIILDQEYEKLWCGLHASLENSYGLTPVISPGDYLLSIQKLIFDIINPNDITLNLDSYFIYPLKTITFITGIGENLVTPDFSERCKYCTSTKCKVQIKVNDKGIVVKRGEKLIDVLIDENIPINSYCGGKGTCKKCYVLVNGEKELACSIYCYEGLSVKTLSDFESIMIEGSTGKLNIKTPSNKGYGIVIDVGTTTIVTCLYSLSDGTKLKEISSHNPQYRYGLDVISRITYSLTHADGLMDMHIVIKNHLKSLINELTQDYQEELKSIVLVGNPTMISIINNIPLEGLATYPFETKVDKYIYENGKLLNLSANIKITFIYAHSSFIGSDIIAGIVSSDFHNSKDYNLLIDLGTNGELALGNKDIIYTCSCASGPAFEGANITLGTPSISGAIYQIDLDNNYKTIDNKKPIGFCGSGIIDYVSKMLDGKVLDSSGSYIKEPLKIENKYFLNQNDIRNVQLAKSAIITGIELLIKTASIDINNIKNVYLSGGFGSNINIDSCIRIGLIPKELKDKVKLIGNSAIKGAALYLLSENYQSIFDNLKPKIKTLDLVNNELFGEFFINNLKLDYKEKMS